MAEFCIECAKEHLGFTSRELKRAILSEELDYCEGCGQWKPVVVVIRPGLLDKLERWLRGRLDDN